MTIETSTYISELNTAYPEAGSSFSEGDDHIRKLKANIKATFPNFTAIACTPSSVELNYVTGVTSAIQTQFTAQTAATALKANLTSPIFSAGIKLGSSASASYGSQSIAVDQAGNSDEIMSYQSVGTVVHGMSTLAATGTFGTVKKYSAANGGLHFTGYSASTVGAGMRGIVTTEDSTRSTAAVGAIVLSGSVKSGATSAAMSANTNVMVITDGTNARFIFDSDGDSHQDVGTAWTNYDHLDDVATLDAIAYNVARADDPIKRKFGEWMQERKDHLTEQNLVKFNENGHHFVNMSKLTMLHTGAIRQMGEKLTEALETINTLTAKLNTLELKNA